MNIGFLTETDQEQKWGEAEYTSVCLVHQSVTNGMGNNWGSIGVARVLHIEGGFS